MVRFPRLSKDERQAFAEKIMEWGNLSYIGLVITQIVPGTEHFRTNVAIIGIINVVIAYVGAYLIMKGGKRR